jgi:hypothetical protein
MTVFDGSITCSNKFRASQHNAQLCAYSPEWWRMQRSIRRGRPRAKRRWMTAQSMRCRGGEGGGGGGGVGATCSTTPAMKPAVGITMQWEALLWASQCSGLHARSYMHLI